MGFATRISSSKQDKETISRFFYWEHDIISIKNTFSMIAIDGLYSFVVL
jgi:hypothetical protein